MYDENEVIELDNDVIIVNKNNGNVVTIPNEMYNDYNVLEEYLKDIEFDALNVSTSKFDPKLFKTIYISLHTSSKCNLNCTYCFNEKKEGKNLNFEKSSKFINLVINEYPNAGKYIVDPTGSGEPLLNKQLIYDIGEYCKTKSDELKVEVLPMIVTNGILLKSKTVDSLRNSNILFGVSLDGNKKDNDYYRKNHSGQGSYRKVINNIKNINDRSLMGVAVTLTDKNLNIVKTVKHLIKYFPTISIKPVRSEKGKNGINQDNIHLFKNSYSKLNNFLIQEITKGNLSFIAALLNGDDFFGKFILRTILGTKTSTRCDAGLSRFSLSENGNIYACPGGSNIDSLIVGQLDTGINEVKREEIWKLLTERSSCGNCFARFVCGGECMVSSYYNSGTLDTRVNVICDLKTHLYKLALIFKYNLLKTPYYKTIELGCREKVNRFDEDKKVTEFLVQNPDVTFMQLKTNRNRYLKKGE